MSEQSPVSSDGSQGHRHPALPPHWEIWNDRHKGEDIYILGASAQLAFLTDSQLAALSKQVVIGGNNTFYKAPLTYFMSSYAVEIHKAALHLPLENLIHIKDAHATPINDKVTSLARLKYYSDLGLNRHLTYPLPSLFSPKNQAFAMLHMAIVMGARRAIFVGVDQTNYAYFWQYDDALRAALRRDAEALKRRQEEIGASDAYFDTLFALLEEPAEVRERMAFYTDFTPVFSEYVGHARAFGTEVFATLENSIVHKAGATYAALDDALEGRFPAPAPPPAEPAPRTAPTASAAPGQAGVPPLLIVGLSPATEALATALRGAGALIGTDEIWSDRSAEVLLEWARKPKAFRHRELLFDYPEPLFDALSSPSGFLAVLQKVMGAFAPVQLMPDLFDDDALRARRRTFWTMDQPWGWRSRFDAALVPVLEHLFPGLRVVHVQTSDKAAMAEEFVEDFKRRATTIPAVQMDEHRSQIRVHGGPPRQMDVVEAGEGPLVGRRFSLRCADRQGALGMVDVYEHLGAAAVDRLGAGRALAVSDEEVTADPEGVARRILRTFAA